MLSKNVFKNRVIDWFDLLPAPEVLQSNWTQARFEIDYKAKTTFVAKLCPP
jgi:hypothetical protein